MSKKNRLNSVPLKALAERGLVRLAVKGFSGFAALTRLPPAKSAAIGSAKLNSPATLTPLLAFTLAACGGGGSSSSSAPPANTPPPLTLPNEIPLEIYENHPTNKAVYDATPQGQSAGEISLAANYGDNDLFRLTSDGRIWWNDSPDFENRQDADDDGTYLIRINHPHNARGYTEVNVRVEDIDIEVTFAQRGARVHSSAPQLRFSLSDIEDILPANDLVLLLLWGSAFVMPREGPLILTWSFQTHMSPDTERNFGNVLISQEAIDQQRPIVQRAFADWEQYANLKFIEVSDSDQAVGDIRVSIGRSLNIGAPHGISVGLGERYSTYLHEIGHALGLGHPFFSGASRPADAGLAVVDNTHLRSDISVMTYAIQSIGITQNDIDAVQFLYGVPGTNFDGVQGKLEDLGVAVDFV